MTALLPTTTAKASDVGAVRSLNEDYVEGRELGRGSRSDADPRYVAVVADGMGGHNCGEIASRLAVETFLGSVEDSVSGDPDEDLPEYRIARAFRAANDAVYRESQVSEKATGMGTTLTAAVAFGNTLHIGHVGDTRAYLVRAGTIRQITRDDSWVAEQVDSGVLTEEEAHASEHRSLLTRAIGTSPEVPIRTYREDLQEGDVLILATDGLHNALSGPEIGDILAASRDIRDACRHLIGLAKKRDGSDNISVVCAEFGDRARRAPTRPMLQLAGDRSRRRGLLLLALILVIVAVVALTYGLSRTLGIFRTRVGLAESQAETRAGGARRVPAQPTPASKEPRQATREANR